jgi:uncharacterized membrane protein YheB (UPF0754 family)
VGVFISGHNGQIRQRSQIGQIIEHTSFDQFDPSDLFDHSDQLRDIQFFMNYWLIVTPLIAAFIGWLIHVLALRFFFQSVLPKRQQKIASGLGKMAAAGFASFKGIEEKINDPNNLTSIMPVIEQHIDHFLNERLKQEMPMISMFIGNKTTDKLKEVFLKELQALFPQVIGQFAGNLRNSIDVEKLVTDRINSIPPSQMENAIKQNVPGLKYLPLLGAFSGLVIGLITVLIQVLSS